MVFTRRRKLPGMKPITYKGEEVEIKKEFKYLGVTLDDKLIIKYTKKSHDGVQKVSSQIMGM